MRTSVTTEEMSEAEYVQWELRQETRHEYINGNLIEMPGEKDINNRMVLRVASWFLFTLRQTKQNVYSHDMKVGIPGKAKYYYPDAFITDEPDAKENQYIKRSPTLILEVVSESTHTMDYVDKYIDYTTIPSLEYYLIVEPETILVTLNERTADGWVAHKYTSLDSEILLPHLDLRLPMREVYP